MKRFAEATAELRRLQAELELAIADLRGSYAKKIDRYKSEQQGVAEHLQRYAQDNYSTLFAKAKRSTIGYRSSHLTINTLQTSLASVREGISSHPSSGACLLWASNEEVSIAEPQARIASAPKKMAQALDVSVVLPSAPRSSKQ